jgi:hypothetical protein
VTIPRLCESPGTHQASNPSLRIAGSEVAVWVGVDVNVGVGDGGRGVWLGTLVAVGGADGVGGKAVGDGAGVATGEQAERSRAARRMSEVSQAKRAPEIALRLGQ